jgi:hypothetical protein
VVLANMDSELEVVFILLEPLSPSRRSFIGSHSLPPLWFAVSVLQLCNRGSFVFRLSPYILRGEGMAASLETLAHFVFLFSLLIFPRISIGLA